MRLFNFILLLTITFTQVHCGLIKGEGEDRLTVKELDFEDEDIPPSLNQTSGCGGVLVAHRGFIGYKANETYNNNERCTWTIRTDRVATLIHIRTQGFHSLNDYISVYTLNVSGTLVLADKIHKNSGNKLFEFLGPVIFLTFTTDQAGTGNGFHLEYIGFAYKENTQFVYNNFNLEANSGVVSYPPEPPRLPRNELVTFSISPLSNHSLRLTVNHVDMGKMYNGCPHNYFSVHQLFRETFDLRLRYCEPDLQNTAVISSSSPVLITFFATTGPRQTGFSFSWENREDSNLLV